jgi:hypothetical protein
MAARMPQTEQEDTLDELLLNRFDEIISLVPGNDPLRLRLVFDKIDKASIDNRYRRPIIDNHR